MEVNLQHLFSKTNSKRKCQVACLCSGFSTNNYTCMHKGGNYCGKYRTIKYSD